LGCRTSPGDVRAPVDPAGGPRWIVGLSRSDALVRSAWQRLGLWKGLPQEFLAPAQGWTSDGAVPAGGEDARGWGSVLGWVPASHHAVDLVH
jgi:hypothetical protein